MLKLEQLIKKHLKEMADVYFSTGTEERRSAGLLIDDAMLKVHEVIKAFGGCTKCYGKGYSTSKRQAQAFKDFGHEKASKWELDPVIPCSCDRGKQLKEILKK